MSPLLYSARYIHYRGNGTVSACLLGILIGVLLALSI